ncbi:permease [bacterium]|nr:permease [bacterium]
MNTAPWWTGPFKSLGNLLAYNLLGLDPKSHFGSSVQFFIWDVIKILFLLTVIVFAVAIIRSFFSPERSRRILGGKHEWAGNILASLLGVVTPFCSCSACPLFIGFVESGIPLGVAMSFLISAPTVNEVALILLLGLFGWRVAGLYLLTGVLMAIVAGMVIGRLRLERFVEEYVWQVQMAETEEEDPTWADRLAYAKDYTKTLMKKVGPWVLIGVGVAAGIHGYVPVEFVARAAGQGNPLAVPIAVLIGIPLYSNAAGTIPIVQVLVEKGVPIGTALALMMSIVAISVPEMLILRQVVKWPLLGVFAGVVVVAIIIIGTMFNTVIFPGGTPPEIMQQLQSLGG